MTRPRRWYLIPVVLSLGLVTVDVRAVEEVSGEAVGGLQLRATVENSVWRVGTTKAVHVILTNVGTSPYLVDLFGDLNEVYQGKRGRGYVTSCWALAWQPQAVAQSVHRGPYTLSAEQFYRLAPSESLTQRLSLELVGVPPGTYQVRIAYVPRASASTFSFPDHWETQHGFKDPMWRGMVLSNPLTIEVVE